MRTKCLLLAAALLAVVFPKTTPALTVDQAVTPQYLRQHPEEFSVKVKKETNGLLAFTIVRTLSERKYLVAHLTVRQQDKILAESHTPVFARKGENTFFFSVLPEHVDGCGFEIGESFLQDGVPVPGTVNYQFRLEEFVPKDLLDK